MIDKTAPLVTAPFYCVKPEEILDFWFGAPGDPDYEKTRPLWFTKSDATDQLLRDRFGNIVEAGLNGGLDDWALTPRGALASIIVLDQFTRNIYRDTPRSFAGDGQALRLASNLVDRNDDRLLAPVERWFAYMPFEHSEFLNDQLESVRLFQQLAKEGLEGLCRGQSSTAKSSNASAAFLIATRFSVANRPLRKSSF